MSSRKLSSNGEGMPSSRCGERSPLRSLENHMLCLSTPSHRLKSKSLLSWNDLKTTQGDNPLCDTEPHFHSSAIRVRKTSDTRAAENKCGLTAGEVEISRSSAPAEESIALPNVQVIENTCEIEDTVTCDSMILQSFSDHVEHLYYTPEINEFSLVDIDAACVREIPSTSLAFRLDDKCATQDSGVLQNDCCGERDVTWKSFVYDGGEVEISDITRLQDNTIPLPKPQLGESLRDNSVNPTNFSHSHYDQVHQAEDADHPYCSSENYISVITGFSANSLCDVTFKSLNCTGGEIEISDGTKHDGETVPFSVSHTTTCSEPRSYDVDPSIFAGDLNVSNSKGHLDHPYCNSENNLMNQSGNLYTVPQALPHSSKALDETGEIQLVVPNNHIVLHDGVIVDPFNRAESGVDLSEGNVHDVAPIYVKHEPVEDDKQPNFQVGNNDSMLDSHQSLLMNASFKMLQPVEVQHLENVDSSSAPPESSEGKDSALGSTGNGPVHCNLEENACSENLTDVLKVLSECPSVASGLQFGILSPIVRRASQATQKTNRDPILNQFLGDDSALEVERTFVPPINPNPAGLWAEHLDSPMPRPLFNSTTLGYKPLSSPNTEPNVGVKPYAMPQSKLEKPALDIPVLQDGPLQQQLRQMAEFLMLASGKMGPALLARATSVETNSVCVGTTTVQMVDHSLNTSGIFERKRDFSVADSCTLTDPLLWNVPPGSLECLPRQELEQRLRSSMIMVEALVQQLAAARAHRCSSAGPAPSELREKLVQTDHTELNQTTIYRDLYMEALRRISQLELDGGFLHNLIQSMQDMRVTMISLSSDTEAVLSNMSQIGDIIREDHQSLVCHYGQMKSLFDKTKNTHKGMMQKVKDALQQRNDMRTQMEEAFTAKEAAFGAIEQLRTHCATQISGLENCVGSQQDLLAVLNKAYPEQVALNQAYNETLNSASDLLNQTMEEQFCLRKELCTVRGLLQKTAPMLLKLNEKAEAALRERDEHVSAREQAIEEREQMEEELSQANMDLQTARERIGDLNLQVTILTSEMGVLRQKLTEREEERGQLERKVTELSATVSSSLASYTFLEQAFDAETTKLQQSWKDIQQAKNRANELEISLGQSDQHVSELSQALAQSEEQISQLQTLSQSQQVEIQQLQDLCKQLNGVREMNEFLQMENDLAREQVAESERMLRANLQGLRERNLECEDLKGELGELQLENRSLQEQLETTRSKARAMQLELGERLAHAVTEITLLHHTLRGLTNELHAALNEQTPEVPKEGHNSEYPHPSSSFVDRITVTLTNEKEEAIKTETPPGPDTPGPQCETLFSEMSAFTRIAVITPKKRLNAREFEPDEDEQTNVTELLADLGSTVTELVDAVKLVRQRKNDELEELHNIICGLQREQQAANSRHDTEVSELKHQLRQLSCLVERGSQALQQKTQDEKTVTRLMAEINEIHEILNKHKTDNNELRKEAVELRRSLQQSKVESQFLREEMKKTGAQSATPTHFMEEKIELLKEVERLKVSLQEVEQARVKLLERAKRHQMIHLTNQLKSENELQMLNNMINKVRETLLSLPEVVKNCEQLQQLVEYIG